MKMPSTDLKLRTKKFGLDVISLFEALPNDETSRILGRDLLRSATSLGKNYRAARRAKSDVDFMMKMALVKEGAGEAGYWIEMLTDCGKVTAARSAALLRESNELVAIAVAAINGARHAPRKTSGSLLKEH